MRTAVEGLLERARPNRPRSLDPREQRVELVSAALFCVAACLLVVMNPAAGDADVAALAGFVAAYALFDRVRLYVGAGFGAPTQLVLVPMLYALPPAAVPAAVAAALVANAVIDLVRGRGRAERLLTSVGDGWFALGPAAVFLIAQPGSAAFGDVPLIAAALAAQCACDVGSSMLREALGRGVHPQLQFRVLRDVYAVDLLLAGPALVVAVAAGAGAGAYVAALPLLGVLALLARDRTTRIDQAMDRLDALTRERARLRKAIRRTGQTMGVTLDRDRLTQVLLDTALDALDADGAAALIGDDRLMTRGSASAALSAALREGGDAASSGGVRAIAGRIGERDMLAVARAGLPFSDDERDLLRYLAAQAAVSLENVALHEAAQLRAEIDELTGLANHRCFGDVLATEVRRAERSGTTLSLVLLDVDDFKVVNDTYGHVHGDLVLRSIGRLLRERSRSTDLPARYGGEEFAVLLPDTGLIGAMELAETLRLAIAACEIGGDGDPAVRLTASIGVASLPDCGPGREQLLEAADRALYQAKRAGKNRVLAAPFAMRQSA